MAQDLWLMAYGWASHIVQDYGYGEGAPVALGIGAASFASLAQQQSTVNGQPDFF